MAMLGGGRAALLSGTMSRALLLHKPVLMKPQAASFASSQDEKARDFGDVAVDEGKKAAKKGEYTVKRAAKLAERGAEEAGEAAESFKEKTRRTVETAWVAAKDTAEEIKEGVKRQTSDA